MRDVKIAPSILSADFSDLKNEVCAIDKAGADWIHLDVMDGHFVPNITFGPALIKAIRPYTHKKFDAHLMISNPEKYIEAFVQSGVNHITFHVETVLHAHRLIQYIKSFNIGVGISFNPSTSLSLLDYIIHDVDLILIMTVNPGFGGQKFIPYMIDKIALVKKMIDHHKLKVDIQADGGVNKDNALSIIKAGANILVAGSAVFGENKKDYKKNIDNLRGL